MLGNSKPIKIKRLWLMSLQGVGQLQKQAITRATPWQGPGESRQTSLPETSTVISQIHKKLSDHENKSQRNGSQLASSMVP